MIIQTTKEINGVVYDYAYSDSGFMIERDGVRYSEAVTRLISGDYTRRQTNQLTSAQERKQWKITRPHLRYWVWKRRRAYENRYFAAGAGHPCQYGRGGSGYQGIVYIRIPVIQ